MTNGASVHPRWYIEPDRLLDPKKRHEWLASQLDNRRHDQSRDQPYAWLSKAVNEAGLVKLFEVVSEGLGGAEPFWWGLRWTQQHALSGLLAEHEVQDLSTSIYKRRQRLSGSVAYKTQREIGQDLYEPTVFWISEEEQEVFCLVGGQWLSLSEDVDLPVIVTTDENVRDIRHARKQAIRRSLLEVSQEVLWPGFFRDDEGARLSIVYIHTSLFHQG